MRAIIISAGKGTRLYPLTKNTPKCLLQVSGGTTILESQIETLKHVGITDIHIITGYLTEQVEARVRTIDDVSINIIYNPFYEEHNNLHSLWMAKHFMDCDMITINGDDIFTEQVIEPLLKRPEDIVMTISRKEAFDDDDMKVVTIGDAVRQVGKDLPNDVANGESIGIIKYSRAGTSILREVMEQMVKSGKHKNSFYLKSLQSIMDKHIRVSYEEIPQDQWQEMDFHGDYELVQELINRKYEMIARHKVAH